MFSPFLPQIRIKLYLPLPPMPLLQDHALLVTATPYLFSQGAQSLHIRAPLIRHLFLDFLWASVQTSFWYWCNTFNALSQGNIEKGEGIWMQIFWPMFSAVAKILFPSFCEVYNVALTPKLPNYCLSFIHHFLD